MVSPGAHWALQWGRQVGAGMSGPWELSEDFSPAPHWGPRAEAASQGQRRETPGERGAEAGPSSPLTAELGLPGIQSVPLAPHSGPRPPSRTFARLSLSPALLGTWDLGRACLHPWSPGRERAWGARRGGLLETSAPLPPLPPPPSAFFQPQASSVSSTSLSQPLALRT